MHFGEVNEFDVTHLVRFIKRCQHYLVRSSKCMLFRFVRLTISKFW